MSAPHDHLLRTFAAVPPSARVLDVGCGDGVRAASLALLGFTLDACDRDAGAVAATRERLADAGADEATARVWTVERLAEIGGEDGRYDWVVLGEDFAHLGSREALLELLAEARRVLVPGGWLYLLVPAVPDDANPHDPPAAYAADSAPTFTFTPETLTELVEEAGLAVAERSRRGAAGFIHGIFRRVEEGTVG